MGKSKLIARLPRDQRCEFLIGPISSWFMPNTSDLWTRRAQTSDGQQASRPTSDDDDDDDEGNVSMDSDDSHLSYFAYGSIGCFCYGEIHRTQLDRSQNTSHQANSISGIARHLVDIKAGDNSRVICIRFSRSSLFPIVMVLTEGGSLTIHDCVRDETLMHVRKSELISKVLGPIANTDYSGGEHHNKRTKFNVIQQINSFVWPSATNTFLGISLLKDKTNLLIWMKLKDLTLRCDSQQQPNKPDLIESHQKIDLDLPQYPSPICCMESAMLDEKTCILAVAMDDGLIKIVVFDMEEGKTKRLITLARHTDQVCSMSIFLGDRKRFPIGMLASVSRNGLTILWDIENEFYFADYQAGGAGARINWFSLSFVSNKEANATSLAISNSDSGLTILELPENNRSKIRLKEPAKERQQKGAAPAIRHQALVFNVIFEPNSEIIMTSSLDGNHIVWSSQKAISQQATKKFSLEVKPQYLIPSLPNNSRVHMMRHSPIQENLLGICLGKAGLRFYKISENLAQSRFDMSPAASLLARKITKLNTIPTSITWHPRNEYRVAIGTIEGKVLRLDLTPNRASITETENRKRKPRAVAEPMSVDQSEGGDDPFGVEYKPVSHETSLDADSSADKPPKTDGIYSICWGPSPTCPQDENRLAIYAIGSITHRLFIYQNNRDSSDSKMTNYLEEFMDESLPEAIGEASEVAWKSTSDLMALGTTHGRVIIAEYLEESHADRSRNRLFRKLAVIEGPLGSTYIQCLVWHPTLDEDDERYYHIACSANESPVFVFDVRSARLDTKLASAVRNKLRLENCTNGSTKSGTGESLTAISGHLHKLEAHTKPVSDIAWNPHNPNQLATCSFDRSCYVWSLDASSASARISSKYGARDRLFTLEWSLVDDDLLYTSGHDSIVWAWRPSENLNKTTANEMQS